MNKLQLERSIVEFVLGSASRDDFPQVAEELLRHDKGRFDLASAEAISGLSERYFAGTERLKELADVLAACQSASGKYAAGRILAATGDSDRAIELFGDVLDAISSPDPSVLLERARLMARSDRIEEASEDFRLALQLNPPYPFYVKCRAVLERILASGRWTPRRSFKFAIVGSSTTALLAGVLRACCFRDGIQMDFYEGQYGSYQQEIFDDASGLYEFAPDVVAILINHRDLHLPPDDGMDSAEGFIETLRSLWSVLRNRIPCHILQFGVDMPWGGAWGNLEDSLPQGRRRLVRHVNSELSSEMPSGVSFLDVNEVAGLGGQPLANPVEWARAKQYPGSRTLPLLANTIASHLRSILGLTSKVLITDLDNTLWGGVIGEDGLSGIEIGPPSPKGEGYLALQNYMKELQSRGILLAVCSKNNLEEAELPFRDHDSMLLKLTDFHAFIANWNDKAANIRAIADELSLGLESFVFLDDNPLERAWVRSQIPQVVVPECGKTPWEMMQALQHGKFFENLTVTKEDLGRGISYQVNRAMRTQASPANLEGFLQSLQMRASQGPVDDQKLPRVTQLINKTNQFNLTTKRYTEEQVAAKADSQDWWCRWFRLVDRFGDHGLIGVLLAQKSGNDWEVDTWLMSCRVLGRQMEEFMWNALADAAREHGCSGIKAEYRPTAKNALVKDLYEKLGFEAFDSDDERTCYRFDLTDKESPRCAFIEDAGEL